MGIFNKNKKSKLGIAFGGGGARGFAHLGVIKALEEYGIKAINLTGGDPLLRNDIVEICK